jgi:cell division protein FtsI (penicillin-binding protein 3)
VRRKRVRSKTPGRLVGVFVIFTLLFTAMAARLVVVQIVEAPRFKTLAADQRERVIPLPAKRGAIFDRNGESLAITLDYKMVFVDPAHVTDPVGGAAQLAKVLGQDPAMLEAKLRGSGPEDRFDFIARQVDPNLAKKIQALDIEGIYFETEPKRYYPGARLGSHLLGFVNVEGTAFGGVEGAYDGILAGHAGEMTLEQDPAGVPLPQAEYTQTRARPGRSLFLTIDKEIQYFTEETLLAATNRYKATAASAVVMRVGTGEILALANVPTFDANDPGKAPPEAQRNRAVTDIYEPGSAFKIITASAALEEGTVTPKTTFVVPDQMQVADRIIQDSHPHPTEKMTVSEIIEQSSNVGTVQVGQKLGGALLQRYIKAFGFGSGTGADLPAEAAGIVLPLKEWSGSSIGNIPIGQGVAVTPLQMAAAYQTIANGGIWVEPKLLYSTMDSSGDIETAAAPAVRSVISRQTASEMRKILARVVKVGTGLEAQIPGYNVAGKTGTAQKPAPGGGYGSTYVGSFGGFAPATRPEIVVFVMLDEPSPIWGGSTAAPTFRTIAEFTLRHLGVAPTGDAEKAAKAIEREVAEEEPAHD